MKTETTTDMMLKSGFDFGFDPGACADCGGRCCRGDSGYIWVNQREIQSIIRFLGANPIDFMEACIRRVDNRLSIGERQVGTGFQCVFLEMTPKARCRIYPVRPMQCRTFPFWDRYRNRPPKDECPGIREPA